MFAQIANTEPLLFPNIQPMLEELKYFTSLEHYTQDMQRLVTSAAPRAVEQFQPLLPASICAFCQLAVQPLQRRRRAPFSTSSQHGPTGHSTFGNPTRPSVSSTGYTPNNLVGLQTQTHRQASTRVTPATEDYEPQDGFQAQQDARLYAQQLRLEEKAAWQAQVDDAPMHQDYIPASTWDGLEMVGGEKEWNTGRKYNGYACDRKTRENRRC